MTLGKCDLAPGAECIWCGSIRDATHRTVVSTPEPIVWPSARRLWESLRAHDWNHACSPECAAYILESLGAYHQGVSGEEARARAERLL